MTEVSKEAAEALAKAVWPLTTVNGEVTEMSLVASLTVSDRLSKLGYTIAPIAKPVSDEKLREAVDALMDYQPADEDGVMVLTSRQAIHEVVDGYKAAIAELEKKRNIWESRHFTDYEMQEKDAKIAELCATIDLQLSELAERRDAQTWQPIETAPRDGDTYLFFDSYSSDKQIDGYGTCTARWDFSLLWWIMHQRHSNVIPLVNPTHWMPLPNRPATEGV